MKNWIKKLLGLKDYKSCAKCGLLFEPETHENAMYNHWCPEHRKPYIEQRALERWAVSWAIRNPEEARKAKAIDEIEQKKTQVAYSQALGNMLNQQAANLRAAQSGLY